MAQTVDAGAGAARRLSCARHGLRDRRLPEDPPDGRIPTTRGGPVPGDAGRESHRCAPGPGRRDVASAGQRLGRRDHLRICPSQLHRAGQGVRRVRPRRATGWPDQPARGGRARPRTPAVRRPHLVPPGRSGDRRLVVRWCRLPLPSQVDGVSPSHRTAPVDAHGRRVLRSQPAGAVGRAEPTYHCDPERPAVTAPIPIGALGLVATRFPLDPGPAIDPFTLAGSSGIVVHTENRVLVGLGTALTIPLGSGLDSDVDIDRVAELLASIECSDHLDTGDGPEGGRSPAGAGHAVVAFGALPFDRSAPTSLVVPEVLYSSDHEGGEWVTVVGTDRAVLPATGAGLRSQILGGKLLGGLYLGEQRDALDRPGLPEQIHPLASDDDFCAMVARAIAAIDKGELVKVVLARHVDVIMSKAIRVDDLLRRWSRLEPNCTIFSLPTAEGQFVGASPELLVERSGTDIHSRPLAGTTDRFRGDGGSALPVELLESAKDSAEHRLVVDAIERALRPLTSTLDVPTEPDLVHLHNITHLGTSIIGRLAAGTDDDVPSVLALVAALHPTPAVGGEPVASARAMIARSEPQSRGSYAGPVGYVDAAGDGMWVVGIRAMTIRGRTARLSAGVGIVEGSEPSTELVEANLKFTAVFDALAPGVRFSTANGSGTGAGPRAAVG